MKHNTIIYKALALSLLMIIGSVNYVWGYGGKTSYVLNQPDEISLGAYSNSNGVTYELTGPAQTLSFEIKKYRGATQTTYVYGYDEYGNETEIASYSSGSLSTSYVAKSIDISQSGYVKIKFKAGGTLNKYISKVLVTRATNITAKTTSINFGTQAVKAKSTEQASFTYNNTTYNQQVTGTCPTGFSVTPTDVADTGTSSVDINYSSETPGIHSGTITLNMNGASTTLSVSGKTEATYDFSATATPNYSTHGSATASVGKSSITSTNSTVSTRVKYTATPNPGYEFVGWGASADATTYESTDTTYTTTISATFPTTTASKTLYAIFRPVFYFSVDARKIYDHGTVTASVTDKILGTPTETSKTAQATFTATPADGCTFEGWYYDQAHENKASSDLTYTPTITNNTIGSTENLTLYAWFKKNQSISWVEDITDFNLVVGTSANCSATASSGLTVTYKSSNGTTATVSTDGKVTGNAASNDGVVITASQLGNDEYHAATDIVRTFYVLEKYQATFTPNGFTGNNPTLKVGDAPTITVTNTDGDFTFTSSAPEVVGISREGDVITLTALKSGTATVTLNQAANATHSNSSAEYNITVERHQGGLAITIPETMKVGDTKRDFWVTNNDEVMVDVNIDNTSVLTYAEGTLTAVGEGTATVTVSQAETVKWAGESRQQTVVVSKVQNTLGVSITNQEATVDGTINVKLSNQNNISTPVLASITEQILSSAVTNGTDVITYADGIITAKNAGTAKITFTQAASDKYTEYTSATYEISVSKISNQISMTLNGQSTSNIKLEYNKSAKLAYTSAHTDSPLIVERTSGTCTTYTNNVISAGSNPGTDLYTISQAETYKYEAGYTTFSIRVNNTTEEEMYIINDPKEYYDFTLTTLKSYSFEGHPGDIVKFEAKRVSLGSNSGFYLDYSTDNGATWQENWYFISTTTDYNTYAVTLPEDVNVTNVRFELYAGSTLNKYVRNVRVTRKTYVRASSDKTDFGTVYTGNTGNAHFTVDYSTTNGGNILLSSNNSNFALSTTELSTSENTDSTHTFDVTYTPDPNKLGSESATITISDLFYTQEFILTAKAEKRANSLSVISAQNLKVDATVNNVYSNKNSTATLNVALSNEGVITYDEGTNTATAIGEGTTTLTFTQNANDQYYATSKSVTFVVTKNANTLNIALDKTDLKVEETANVTFSEQNSDGEITVAYTVDNIVTYDNDVITALNAGTTRITLTQAATASHTGTSQSFDITVSKHDQTISWDDELSGSHLSLNIGETLNTNTATASSQMAVTYTSSNPTILKVDANTGELTALAGGANIVITATQAGNYKYNEVSIKRSFTVISKIDATVSTTLSDQETNILTVGEGSVTIGSNATLSESNFTIEGNDNGYITTSFANNTLTITPIKAGGAITITLTRDEDNGYNAVRKSYDIMVEGPILTLDPTTAPAVEYAGSEYSEVTLKRTLKAGFNSIALPFDTDVATIAGSSRYNANTDWVAQLSTVTYNAHDGYTLYFTKVDGGVIKANQPYILHLGSEIENQSFTNVVVYSPQATSISATKGYNAEQWQMVSNYTPKESMQGRYGVVNAKNCLKIGSATSTINAFAAYISYTGGAAPSMARTAFAGDESTDIDSIDAEGSESDGTSAYDLSGRRISRSAEGIKIVISPDGKATKVMR